MINVITVIPKVIGRRDGTGMPNARPRLKEHAPFLRSRQKGSHAAAVFLVTAVSGNLTSMTFGRRRGILSLPCIVGSSRASHRGCRQMKIGPSIALSGPTIIRAHYPPSSDGSSSLATAVSLRGGGIDANSSDFQLGYQLGRILQKMLIFLLGKCRPAHQKQAGANRPQISVPPSA